ncbi:epidermal growth factor receptor substrate 15-like 1 [Dorcoceras hygrometricum]|uniref:Epidermal growth factor receptor substrate 15-like 1 n=1 Tax=Dorcoceras hygrometricum TaxID=472368 RepID=A0A2Z7C5K3_9LAMI|nr:epidermal growth factor receptor substrate 15-like 1 [Dorcoceras hygrometricum]
MADTDRDVVLAETRLLRSSKHPIYPNEFSRSHPPELEFDRGQIHFVESHLSASVFRFSFQLSAFLYIYHSCPMRNCKDKIWTYADQNRTGFLGRAEFYNALKLVTVAQTKRDLTPDIVKAALYGPASAKIPAPEINLAVTASPQLNSTAGATPLQLSATPISSQVSGISGPHGFQSQQSQFVRPPQPLAPSYGLQSQPGISGQGPIGAGSSSVPSRPSLHDSFAGSTNTHSSGISSQVSNRSLSYSTTEGGFGHTPSSSAQPKPSEMTGLVQSSSSKPNDTDFLGSQVGTEDSKPAKASGNGFSPDSVFGDVFSVTPSEPKPNSSALAYSTGSSPGLSAGTLPTKSSVASQPPSIQAQQFQSTGKANQQISAKKPPVSPVPAGNLTSVQTQPPWPKITPSDVQKYKVLKQVWDLSDQDNDSMLSLREFCIALYLMERYREGRNIPATLPNNVMLDDSQPAMSYGNTSWRPTTGFQQPVGTKNARPISVVGGKPPRPVPVPQPDAPVQQNPIVPALEKHLVDQLSTEEQDSLNKKFEEAKNAEKQVADLEKDILEARQKIQFYQTKMQELADSLARKYEEKYKQVGDVASKLTIEEATFRDIQDKKMELYRTIVKLEQDNSDGIQERANQIQSDLEELVKALNERCKTYGLRGKPTSLVELPFGWQPGIGGTAADWDEVWDKFEDEGFQYVKELTLEVENVIAPPKPKSALIREKVSSLDSSGSTKSPSRDDKKSDLTGPGEKLPQNEREQTVRSPPDSPAGGSAFDSPSIKLPELKLMSEADVNGSPHGFDTPGRYGRAESVLSGGKGFDEPGWGTFDPQYDTVAAWDFNPGTPKDSDRHSGSSLFGPDDWTLNPIRTGSRTIDSTSTQGPFFDSVPSTPLYNSASILNPIRTGSTGMDTPKQGPFFDSVPSTPLYNSASSPHGDNMFPRNSLFADSVPSTPMYNFNTSPKGFNEGSEEPYSFNSFSRFDSFNMSDSGPFGGSHQSLTRFDSMRSSRDSDFDQGYFPPQESSFARFDSFRSTADSDYNFGSVPPRDTFTRFDSMRSTQDSDYGHGFPSFDDAADPFGSNEPFRTSLEGQTPKKDSDSWKAF